MLDHSEYIEECERSHSQKDKGPQGISNSKLTGAEEKRVAARSLQVEEIGCSCSMGNKAPVTLNE